MNIPNSVNSYIFNFLIEERSLAYLLVKKDGELLTWGGKLTEYGIKNLCKGKNVTEQVFFLEGLLPLDNVTIFLPLVNIGQKIFADVHLFPSEEGDWVLLLDNVWDHQYLSLLQQKANAFSLLQEKLR
ncbi:MULTISPECIES: hypothetical protein [unclassified Anabaena]|uniref:hypothetical protein n=1 Tax=unclassified Anabaena TaxID=2619674 RepID=UPI0039C65CCD